MKVQKLFKLMILVLILFLVAGSGLAGELQATESSEAASASAAANAPWFNIEVDTPGNTGQHPSIAIDPATGRIYISYYDATTKNLRLAMSRFSGSGGNCGPGNSWTCQTVDDTYGVGQFSSIAVNPSTGGIGIAYYDATNGQLKYAHGEICAICPWSIDIIDKPIAFPLDNMGKYASIKFDKFGNPSIAYYFEITSGVDSLMVASYVGGNADCGSGTAKGWLCSTIQSGEGVGQYASLALDGSDRPRIAYYHGGNDALMYAYHNGVSWTIREILPTTSGQYASLYVDVDNGDLPHIAHYDSSNGNLEYAVYVGSGGNCGFNNSATKFEWQCIEIESVGTSTHPKGVSLAVDAAGYPIIAYQSTSGSLNVAHPLAALGLSVGGGNCGPENPFSTWYCQTVRSHSPWVPYRQGDYVSIAVNQSGLATIAYFGYITLTQGNLDVSYQRFQIFEPVVWNNP